MRLNDIGLNSTELQHRLNRVAIPTLKTERLLAVLPAFVAIKVHLQTISHKRLHISNIFGVIQ